MRDIKARVLVHLERQGLVPSAVFLLAPDEATAKVWLAEDRYGLTSRGFKVVATYNLGLQEGIADLPTGVWETVAEIYRPA